MLDQNEKVFFLVKIKGDGGPRHRARRDFGDWVAVG